MWSAVDAQDLHRGALIYPSSSMQAELAKSIRAEQGSASFWAGTGKERGWKIDDSEKEEKDKMGSFRSRFR